ncbi:MAG: molybdopterin dehydrogenase [Verrucomicrobia bacterium]|nr:molybdopterin dehydrogenase [Verrucomicrobiota bacterium]
MKSFEYAAPTKLDAAAALLAEQWGETEILAGGTDLVTSLKQHITAPKRVVSLRNISALKGIKIQNKVARVGAMTTLSELAAHSGIKENFPALVTAVKSIGSPQIISVGTVGGDLCQRPRCWYYRNGFGLFGKQGDASLVKDGDNRYHAIFGNEGPAYFVSASSLGPALTALGATIKVAGPNKSTRSIAAKDFFRTPKAENERETALRPNEIVTDIEIPVRGLKNATYEVRHRYGLDWPYVTATVAFESKGGAASNASVVLGHVAPTPWPSAGASGALSGRVDAALAARCGEAAAQGAKPLSGNGYKVQLVKVAVKRAILAAAGIA